MSARPGRVSSWFRRFAESATRTAPDGERVFQSAQSGIATSFSVPVVAPRAKVRAEAPLGAAPEVVDEPDRGHGRDGRSAEGDDRPDEREPQAPEASTPADRRRGRGRRAVARGARSRARSRVVARCSRSSATSRTSRPGAERVDRHSRLDAEAGRHREHRRPRVRPTAGADRRAARACAVRRDAR